MAQFSNSRQPRYTSGRRRPSLSGRVRAVGPTPTRRRGPAPILIILVVIVVLVFCWVFGRGCSGNQQAKENDKLRAYTSTVNKLLQLSAGVGIQFNNLRANIKDHTKADISRELTKMVSDCNDISSQLGKVQVPTNAQDINTRLRDCFDARAGGVHKFHVAILDVLNNKSTGNAASVMSQGMMELVISDAEALRFQQGLEAKLTAAKMTFEKVADSVFVPKQDDALSASVNGYISGISGSGTGSEIHGVAVTQYSTSPARVDTTNSGISILPYSKSFTVKVAVENQGNQDEQNTPVVATLTSSTGGAVQSKKQKITKLAPKETATVVIEGLKPVTGSTNENTVKIMAGPVPNEKVLENNSVEFSFTMRAQGQ
jgi:hypothetical protein